MTGEIPTEEALFKAMGSLDVIRDGIVIVGGAAHRLFRHHALATELWYEPLTTEDVDIATSSEITFCGSPTLAERLTAAGFEVDVRGGLYATHRYRYGGPDGIPYLQFLAHLGGSGVSRGGRRDTSLRFSGIVAEKLRHIDVLLHNPWETHLAVGDQPSVSMRVVNPVAYLIQKLLIMADRKQKRGKDLLYIYDTLAMFYEQLETLAADTELLPALTRNERKKVRKNADRYCLAEGDASIEAEAAAREMRSGSPTSDEIVAACNEGLESILAAHLG